MLNTTKTIIKFFAQALISASLVFILISAPVRRVLSAVKYTIDSSDTVTDITATGVLSIGSAAIDSFLRLYPTDTTPCTQEGAMYYSCNAKVVKFYNGTSWINLAEAAEASGQIVMFDSACPSGWTEVTAFQNKFPRGHDGDATYCETGGSDTAAVPLLCHTHTLFCHRHGIPSLGITFLKGYYSGSGSAPQYYGHSVGEACTCIMGCTNPCYTSCCTGTVGASGESSPTISTIPAYREVVFCKKD